MSSNAARQKEGHDYGLIGNGNNRYDHRKQARQSSIPKWAFSEHKSKYDLTSGEIYEQNYLLKRNDKRNKNRRKPTERPSQYVLVRRKLDDFSNIPRYPEYQKVTTQNLEHPNTTINTKSESKTQNVHIKPASDEVKLWMP